MNKVIECKRCLFNSLMPSVEINDKGICNYCKLYDELDFSHPVNNPDNTLLNKLIEKIKNAGAKKKFDCIIGVSGGTDSTYTLLLAKRSGLRPLAVHFDNGWDSELSVANIHNALQILDIPLETYVVNWEEFKDLQRSFLKASVPEAEIPSDLAIVSVLYKYAHRHNVKYILNGISFRTEGNMPLIWGYCDGKYLKSVHKKFGTVPLKTFPNLTLAKMFYYNIIRRIKVVRFLNYVNYTKPGAQAILEKELKWKNPGGHHYESIYTRWYQGYLSPVKFNIDRRIVALSAQVRSGHILKEKASSILKSPHYPESRIIEDKEYIIKKLGFSNEEFEQILKEPPLNFLSYPSYFKWFRKFRRIIKIASRLRLIPIIYHDKKYEV